MAPLYIQANTIIPVPDTEHLKIRSESPRRLGSTVEIGTPDTKTKHKNDEITHFLRNVADNVLEKLSVDVRPNRRSNWAGNGGGTRSGRRQFHLWYREDPWSNWGMSFSTFLYDKDEESTHPWRAEVGLLYQDSQIEELEDRLGRLKVFDDQQFGGVHDKRLFVSRLGKSLDEAFANELVETICRFIRVITPAINLIGEEDNEEDSK